MRSLLLLFTVALISGCSASTSLIKPNSLEGWIPYNEGGEWTVTDGVIHGAKKADIPHHCILLSEESYSDFRVSVEYNAIHGDSGFYFRLQPADNKLGLKGYHAEIRSDGRNAGGLFDVAVKWIQQPRAELTQKAFKPGDWNQMVITAVGGDITVTLNGIEMSRITGTRSFTGKLGVQLHANEATEVKLRNIRIKKL